MRSPRIGIRNAWSEHYRWKISVIVRRLSLLAATVTVLLAFRSSRSRSHALSRLALGRAAIVRRQLSGRSVSLPDIGDSIGAASSRTGGSSSTALEAFDAERRRAVASDARDSVATLPLGPARENPEASLRSMLGRKSAVAGGAPGDLSADTVAVVSEVVAPEGLRIELKAEGSARTVRVEVLDTFLRLELFWLLSEDEVLTVRVMRDSEGNVERDGATEADGKLRGRSDSAEWDVREVGVGEGSYLSGDAWRAKVKLVCMGATSGVARDSRVR